jgi:hypothetical protein
VVGGGGSVTENDVSGVAMADIQNETIIGIIFKDCTTVNATNNRIHDLIDSNSVSGLTANTGCTNVVFSGNIIEDCISLDSTCKGISFSSDYNKLSDNIVRNIYTLDNSAAGTHTGILIQSGSDYTQILNNQSINNGNLIDRGNCESTTAPMVFDETVPVETNVDTYARSDEQAYSGTYSFKAVGDGGGNMRVTLTDSVAGNHGLIPGTTYTLTAYVYVPSGGYTVGNVKLIYDDDQTAAIYSSAVSAADTWTLLTRQFTVDGASTDLFVGLDVAETGTDSVYWGNIRLLPEGIHNEHNQNFVDSGTGTQLSGNSWQQPIAAEPGIGSPHPITPAITIIAEDPDSGWTTTSLAAYVPKGTRGVYAEISIESTTATDFVFVQGATGTIRTGGFYGVQIAQVNAVSNNAAQMVSVDSNRNIHWFVNDSRVTSVSIILSGYWI